MPAPKIKSKKSKVTLRELGTDATKGLGQGALKKVRGGASGCSHKGEKCGTLHISPMAKSSVLTVVISAPIPK